jgi:YVTN family beta-propeller protein
MKAKNFFPFLLLLLGSVFYFSSCDDECDGCGVIPPAPINYGPGIFVVNEGPFNGTGSVSYYNPATNGTVLDVFSTENGGASLGQFVQSLTFHGERVYVCVNGSNKVMVLDASTFAYIDTVGGLKQPRYFLPIGTNEALISQWGADGLTGSVARVDLLTNQVIQTIPTGKGPDKMLKRPDNTVLVANSGGYGVDSTVSVISLNTFTETQRLSLPGKNPSSLAMASFGGQEHVYVLCKGSYLDATPQGWVGRIDGTNGFQTPPYAEDLSASPGGGRLLFAANGFIHQLNASGLSTLFTQNSYGLAVSALDGKVYCTDAKDFSSAGELVIYASTGTKIMSAPVGIAPGEIVVKE